MKILRIKVFLLFSFLFVIYAIENIFMENGLEPIYEHVSALSKSDKLFLRTEQGIPSDINALFIGNSNVRLHKILHESENLVFECERNVNTACYVSAIAINAVSNNDFLEKCIIKGLLPNHKNAIAINENLAKKMNCSIGDEICLKSALIYETVKVSGILCNFYGFPDFNKDSKFYVIMNYGDEYANSVIGSYYDFSNSNEGAFLAENMQLKISGFWQKIIRCISTFFIISFISNIIIFIFGYKKVLCLKKYYARLFLLGKQNAFVVKERFKDVFSFTLICFLLILLSAVFSGGCVVAFLHLAALLLSSILNFVGSK